MNRRDKKKAKNQKKLDLKKRYKEKHPEEFLTLSSGGEECFSFKSQLSKNEMMRLFLSSPDIPIDTHSDLMSYFDRFEIYKDKVDQISLMRRIIHIATVRSIIFKQNIHFFELLCCDMIMCYFPKQFSKNERQKCYDLLVKDLHKHYPFCRIVDGNLQNGFLIQDGKDITPLMYTFMIRIKYLDRYHTHGLDEVICSDINILLEMLDKIE